MLPTAFPVALSLGAVTLAALTCNDPVALRFAPKEGETRTTAITALLTQRGSDLIVEMGGQEVPKEFLPDLTYGIRREAKTTFVDRFTATPAGASGRWRIRTLDVATHSLNMEMDMGDYPGMEPVSMSVEARSPLTGVPFAIGLDANGAGSARWTEDEHPDDSLLDELRVSLDLEGLLPEDAVEIGASWEAPGTVLRDVLEPSGDLSWDWGDGDSNGTGEFVAAEFEGTLELTLREVSEVDGVAVARIDVEGELIETKTRATDLEQVPVADGTATEVTTMTYMVEGEVLWNLDTNVLYSIELEAEGEGEQVTTRDADQPGPNYESWITLEGAFQISATRS